jgi:hypothetical protein
MGCSNATDTIIVTPPISITGVERRVLPSFGGKTEVGFGIKTERKSPRVENSPKVLRHIFCQVS